MNRASRVLTIAGSDSGGGAGIQADLKTFAAHGVYGLSAVTAVTAQNTLGVIDALQLEPSLVVAQIEAVVSDIGVDAIKVGMLGNASIVRAVGGILQEIGVPIVLDPVMLSKSGVRLLDAGGVDALRAELLPLATVVTPNTPEIAELTELPVASSSDRTAAMEELARMGIAVLLKGGHQEGEMVEDVLSHLGETHVFRHPRLVTRQTHGTGCTLSSAIASRLARGEDLVGAVAGSIDYVVAAVRAAPGFGSGHGPLDHLHLLRQGETA